MDFECRQFCELAHLMQEGQEECLERYFAELEEALDNPPCVPFMGRFLQSVVEIHSMETLKVLIVQFVLFPSYTRQYGN